MTRNDKRAALAAALILGGFGLLFYFLPRIMLALGDWPLAAIAVMAAVIVGPFVLLWLRSRHTKGNNGEG
mgnify:CR=1 FL=1